MGERGTAIDLADLSDAQLVAAAVSGSQPAFQEIVRRYQRPVFNLIARIVRDQGLIEDVAQETFLKVFRGLTSFDRTRRFSSWIFRVANNAAVDALRRRRAGPVIQVEAPEPIAPSTPDQVEAQALGAALDAALGSIRPDWRAAIVLRYDEGLSYEEIADVIGVPEGTVKTFVHRARKQLAERLAAAGWAP